MSKHDDNAEWVRTAVLEDAIRERLADEVSIRRRQKMAISPGQDVALVDRGHVARLSLRDVARIASAVVSEDGNGRAAAKAPGAEPGPVEPDVETERTTGPPVALISLAIPDATLDLPLGMGDILHGFCGGCFGRESYSDKRVEAIGRDWVVARELETGQPVWFAGDPAELEGYR